jgi:hypothetical protein
MGQGLPAWIRPASQLIIALNRAGIGFFTFFVLAIPGRRTGLMRNTVVSPINVLGDRYIISFGALQWVRNARAARWGLLRRGRHQVKVALIEVASPSNRAIVREFPRQIPGGVQFFIRLGLVQPPGGPDEFESAADKLITFKIKPLDN